MRMERAAPTASFGFDFARKSVLIIIHCRPRIADLNESPMKGPFTEASTPFVRFSRVSATIARKLRYARKNLDAQQFSPRAEREQQESVILLTVDCIVCAATASRPHLGP